MVHAFPLVVLCAVLSLALASFDFEHIHELELDPKVTNKVACSTTVGELTIEVIRNWAPNGADRYVDMVKAGFYEDISFFRSSPNFLTQFGANNDPSKLRWYDKIPDDPPQGIPIRHGYMSFAGSGQNSRNAQVFIAYADLDFLGNEPWETPFARVPLTTENTNTLNAIYKGYADGQIEQPRIFTEGNAYLRRQFPRVDYILHCSLLVDDVELGEEQHRRELFVGGRDSARRRMAQKDAAARAARAAKAAGTGTGTATNPKKWTQEQLGQHTIQEIVQKKKEEDERREDGEEVVEELNDEELRRYRKEIRNHHGPHEAPPGECLLLLGFGVLVMGIWQYTKKMSGNVQDTKKH